MIKWNNEYQVYVSDDGRIFNKEMTEYKLRHNNNGYLQLKTSRNRKCIMKLVHRLVYETFNGEIPEGFEVDHINNVRNDNRLENLQLLSRLENVRKACTCKPTSEFGLKYFDHFGYSETENRVQYNREFQWYRRHNNTCRWELMS